MEEKRINESKQQQRQITSRSSTTESLEEWISKYQNVDIKLAVTGQSGSGKSTLINGIRGVKRGDSDYAEVGAFECTVTVKQYRFPDCDNVKVYDLPGVGTPRFPQSTYEKDVDLPGYDIYLVVLRERFNESDAWLCSKIQSYNKSFFIIRTKLDQDIRNTLDEDEGIQVEDIVKEIKEKTLQFIHEKLPDFMDSKFYLLSGRRPCQYPGDFDRLQDDMLSHLPEEKRLLFSTKLRGLSTGLLKEKYHFLVALAWKACLISGASYAALSFLSFFQTIEVDVKVVYYVAQIAKEYLCLRKEDMKSITSINSSYEVVVETILSEVEESITTQTIKKQLQFYSATSTVVSLFPMGSILSGSITSYSTYYTSLQIIKDLYKKAIIFCILFQKEKNVFADGDKGAIEILSAVKDMWEVVDKDYNVVYTKTLEVLKEIK